MNQLNETLRILRTQIQAEEMKNKEKISSDNEKGA